MALVVTYAIVYLLDISAYCINTSGNMAYDPRPLDKGAYTVSVKFPASVKDNLCIYTLIDCEHFSS